MLWFLRAWMVPVWKSVQGLARELCSSYGAGKGTIRYNCMGSISEKKLGQVTDGNCLCKKVQMVRAANMLC